MKWHTLNGLKIQQKSQGELRKKPPRRVSKFVEQALWQLLLSSALMSLGFHYLRRECQWTSTELYLGVNHNKDMESIVASAGLDVTNKDFNNYSVWNYT